MTGIGRDSELTFLHARAEQLARGRKERVTSAHLLAAIAASEGAAATLLSDRRLGSDGLLRAARSATDDGREPIRSALRSACEVAGRMRAPAPNALHLMIALLSDRRTAAYRALDQCGVDLRRLRLAAMNQALGLLGRTPIPSRRRQEAPADEAAVAGERPRRSRLSTRRRAQVVSPEALRHHARALEMTRRAALSQPREASAPVSAPAFVEPAPPPARPAPDEGAFALSDKQPLLARLGHNLSLAAARGELEPVVRRDDEIERVLDVMAKRLSNNPCLIGRSGVGKTRVVHGVAQRLATLPLDDALGGRIVVELSAGALLAGTAVRGGLAERMQALRREVELSEGRVVVFFDEVHQLFSGEGGEEMAAEFKLAISRGELPCLGSTTVEEYAKSIESDPALARRFTPVEIEEPSREDAFLVLESQASKFEAHHQVSYREEALALAIAWSVQYLPGRALPDKAVSIVDLSGARARRRGLPEVTPEQVAEVVSEMASVPTERLLQTDAERVLSLPQTLAERVVGHADCLEAIARSVSRNAAGLGGKRPIGTFLLLGPTGVGKTETAKALAEALFFCEHALTRLDLSEYSEPHSVARLIGAPPGYIGHEAGGQLTEAVRRRPYQVLLLDELEKAHVDVLEAFLPLFDEGRMTDGRGRLVDFSNTVIVMTSNLGVSDSGASRPVGFGSERSGGASSYRERLLRKVRSSLAPEFFNRIDEVLVYEPLGRRQIQQIAERMLSKLAARVEEERELRMEFSDAAVDCLLRAGGVDLSLGARPMQRTISRLVEAPLAEMILRGELVAGDFVRVGSRAGRIAIEREPREVSAAE